MGGEGDVLEHHEQVGHCYPSQDQVDRVSPHVPESNPSKNQTHTESKNTSEVDVALWYNKWHGFGYGTASGQAEVYIGHLTVLIIKGADNLWVRTRTLMMLKMMPTMQMERAR